MRVSIVVPVLNEAMALPGFLKMCAALDAHETIVVDGGSTDKTVLLACEAGATVIASGPGRGTQMNSGAAAASGDILLFLHADVRLGARALEALRTGLEDSRKIGGIFDVYFDGGDWVARFFNFVYHWRRYLGIFYGDAGIFLRREEFARLGGFRQIPIMEDYELGRRMFGWGGRMAFLDEPIHVSDRRWRQAGLPKTLFTWVVIQTLFSAGFPANRLGSIYRHIR